MIQSPQFRRSTLALLTLSLLLVSGCFSRRDESYSIYLRKAEEFQRQEDYVNAIEAYRSHIRLRLESKDREEWENPYFYHLLIGDLYLEQEDIESALNEYTFAQKQNVSEGLVSDRFRLVANWLAERDRYEEAIEILNEYRSSDPLLYDLMRDRIARLLVEREEAKMHCQEGERDDGEKCEPEAPEEK